MAFQEGFNPFGGINKFSGSGGDSGGGAGGGVMIVTQENGALTASYNQLLEAVKSGKHIDLHIRDIDDNYMIYALINLSVSLTGDIYTAEFTYGTTSEQYVSTDADAPMGIDDENVSTG